MNKRSLGSPAVATSPEEILRDAASCFELLVDRHDALAALVGEPSASGGSANAASIATFTRQLRVAVAIVEVATEIIDELMLCDSLCGADMDQTKLGDHRRKLLDEIHGLAAPLVPA